MYDKNSQIIRKTEKNSTAKDEKDHTDKTTEYTYNALGRLTKSVVTDHKNNDEKTITAYSYDPAGNRTKKVKGEEETSYTYNGLNQLLAARTTKGENVKNDITYDYDVNGNQIKETDTETGDSVENTYDVENRLSKAVVTKKDKGSVIQENLYNGEGQRIQKKEGASVTNYFYEDGMVSYTTGADTGEKLVQNLSGLEDNMIYAEKKVSDTYQDFLYTKDIQGSTTSVLGKDNKGELSYEYDDFGETSIHGTSALKNEICYTGGIYDESTGLYYLNARYYDPENGRFLTEDTYRGEVNDPDTLHLYVYCKNNPINYVDPSGHKYSPKKAADYGYKYGVHPNPKYREYTRDEGGDCTNFVSQCVHAGGKKMNRPRGPLTPKTDGVSIYWYAIKTNGSWSISVPWRSVIKFYSYWKWHGAKTIVKNKFSDIEKNFKIGDIVQLHRANKWYHSVIISRKINGEYRYAGHTNNHSKNPVKKLKDNSDKWRIIRIQ